MKNIDIQLKLNLDYYWNKSFLPRIDLHKNKKCKFFIAVAQPIIPVNVLTYVIRTDIENRFNYAYAIVGTLTICYICVTN